MSIKQYDIIKVAAYLLQLLLYRKCSIYYEISEKEKILTADI